ncbi:tyrosine-type recombinase/integrase [Rhodobacterales bacterium HKCCD6035]|nr:tyrosine-type recombinase/integrase [Rhodobacterales bacterium HKCCD6035]
MAHINKNNIDWTNALELLRGAYAQSTIEAYYRDFWIFVQWCNQYGFSHLPSEAVTIAKFLDDQSLTKAPATVRRYAVSIGKIHRLLDMDDPTSFEMVKLAIRRAQRSAIAPQRQSMGLTRDNVNQIAALSYRSVRHLRDATMISVGFDALARRSEIVNIRVSDIQITGLASGRVLIRRSKTDQICRGRWACLTGATCELVLRWLEKTANHEFLFSPVYRAHVIDRALDPVTVQRSVRRAISEIGLNEARKYTGHALRVGAAQELLKLGRSSSDIMRAGGWRSVSSLARYLEAAEQNVWLQNA